MFKILLFFAGYFILFSLIKSIVRGYKYRSQRQNNFSNPAGKKSFKENGIEDADFEELE